jgi:hypothetical protein
MILKHPGMKCELWKVFASKNNLSTCSYVFEIGFILVPFIAVQYYNEVYYKNCRKGPCRILSHIKESPKDRKYEHIKF